MKTAIEDKLDKIADIWNYFIWDEKFCSSKIKFNEDVKTNYFGDIFGYFSDTLEIVFTTNKQSTYTDKFSFTISFLQAIYIQQDFIEELLEIFEVKINKGELKQDPNYSINRALRNELVGHPIRKDKIPTEEIVEKECDSCEKLLSMPKNKLALLSSTVFSYQQQEGEIQYLLYHRENNFKLEVKTYKIVDIQERHRQFLETYFDVMLTKLQSILDKYLSELDKLENVMDKHDFKTVLKLAEIYMESIFKSDFVYDKASLSKIYDRRDEHMRYQNFINRFNGDLRTALKDKRNSVKNIFDRETMQKASSGHLRLPEIYIDDESSDEKDHMKKGRQESFHYEIGKIASKRNPTDFGFFGGILRSKCHNNDLVLSELKNMEQNIFDEIEYYTSLRLICLELKEE